MTDASDITRAVYAQAVVSADRHYQQAQRIADQLNDVDPDNALLEEARMMASVEHNVLQGQIALLRTTGALDGIETEDGAVVRAWLILQESR